jgi:hypothetical protein
MSETEKPEKQYSIEIDEYRGQQRPPLDGRSQNVQNVR